MFLVTPRRFLITGIRQPSVSAEYDLALNTDQQSILMARSLHTGEGITTPAWIAEECGRNGSWALRGLTTLIEKGLAERVTRGWYRLTDAGKSLATVLTSSARRHGLRLEDQGRDACCLAPTSGDLTQAGASSHAGPRRARDIDTAS